MNKVRNTVSSMKQLGETIFLRETRTVEKCERETLFFSYRGGVKGEMNSLPGNNVLCFIT